MKIKPPGTGLAAMSVLWIVVTAPLLYFCVRDGSVVLGAVTVAFLAASLGLWVGSRACAVVLIALFAIFTVVQVWGVHTKGMSARPFWMIGIYFYSVGLLVHWLRHGDTG